MITNGKPNYSSSPPSPPLHPTDNLPHFQINLFTYQRYNSFFQTLSSACSAFPISSPITFTIFVDFNPDLSDKDRNDFKQRLETFECSLGNLTVNYAEEHLGLKEAILTSWNPLNDNEFGLFIVS